ncbi:MAG: hypothetical protein H7X99_01260 [Saprospiraceae bacterium]|nr:hypothetical protein [Saprospiraceae bacterium]
MKYFLTVRKSIYVFAMFLFAITSFTTISCSKDDDKVDECTNFPALDGTITVNSSVQKLSVAQYIASSSGGGFDDTYSFQLAGVSNDCLEQTSVIMFINVTAGAKLGGTYPIKSFFNAEVNDASATLIKQKISPVSQSSQDIESGTIKITNHGTNDFTIDMTGKTITGENIAFLIRHKF